MASGIGATLGVPAGDSPTASFFGEDQARYLFTVPEAQAGRLISEHRPESGVTLQQVGTTGGRELKLGNARAIPVEELRRVHESWFPTYMDG